MRFEDKVQSMGLARGPAQNLPGSAAAAPEPTSPKEEPATHGTGCLLRLQAGWARRYPGQRMEDAVWAAGQPRAHSMLSGVVGNGLAGPGTGPHLGTFARTLQESPEHSRHSPGWAPTLHLSRL